MYPRKKTAAKMLKNTTTIHTGRLSFLPMYWYPWRLVSPQKDSHSPPAGLDIDSSAQAGELGDPFSRAILFPKSWFYILFIFSADGQAWTERSMVKGETIQTDNTCLYIIDMCSLQNKAFSYYKLSVVNQCA